jgi:hypothetical protein
MEKVILLSSCLILALALHAQDLKPPKAIPSEILEAARQGLSSFQKTYVKIWQFAPVEGFSSKQELLETTIGAPILAYTVTCQDIMKAADSADLSLKGLIKDSQIWKVPILHKEKVKLWMNIGRQGRAWKAFNYGDTSAAEVVALMARWPVDLGYKVRYVTATAPKLKFLIIEYKAKCHIRPLQNDIQALGLKKQKGPRGEYVFLEEAILPAYCRYIRK